jgi:hypothetical protein
MSNYIKTVDFAIKDSYASGDPRKIAKGQDVDTEYNNIATAIATKFDSSNVGIAGGVAPLTGGAIISKTFQWTTTAYTDAANAFTQPQSIANSGTLLTLTDASTGANQNQLIVSGANSTDGAGIKLLGNGSTPAKWLRVTGGIFGIVNNAYSTVLFSVDDSGNVSHTGTATGNGANLTSLNASNITSGSIGSGFVPSGAVTQYAASMKCRNHPSKGGVNVTLQSGGSPSGGADGDMFYIY